MHAHSLLIKYIVLVSQLTVLMAAYGWRLEKTMNTTWQKQTTINCITLMTNLAEAGWRSVKEEDTTQFVRIPGMKGMLLWSAGS